MLLLKDSSEICFLDLNNKVFVFLSMEATSDGFPSELLTKFMVTKVLGTRA